MSIEHSRAVRLAAAATGQPESELARRMAQSAVVVSVDVDVPGAIEVATTLVETLRRGPGNVHVDPQTLPARVLAALVDSANAVATSKVSTDPAPDATVTVHVGMSAPPGTIAVLADRHGVRLAVDGQPQCQSCAPSSLGVMAAAAFAGGEVFKRVVRPRAARVVCLDRLAFCPVTLSNDPALGPSLPERWSPRLGLVGNGAVGTAQARILGGLAAIAPAAIVVDPQVYAPENSGTYSLGTWQDVLDETPKVVVVERALDGWQVRRVQGTADDAIDALECEGIDWPRVVLVGLDSIDARRSAQGLWPAELIDAATGDTSVGLHHVTGDGPCLRCFFPDRSGEESAAAILARDFDLPIELVMHGDRVLVEQDLVGLSPAQRERLRPQVGKPICGLADARRLTGNNNGDFRPSVPFVSQQAACLGTGRLVASTAGLVGLPNFVQYDTLIGPQNMTAQSRLPRTDCYCQQRRETIRALRSARQLT